MGIIGNSPFDKDGGKKFWKQIGEKEKSNILRACAIAAMSEMIPFSAHAMSPLSSPFLGRGDFLAS
jgi:hypothetical protein